MPPSIACLDAAYSDTAASAACALFSAWDAVAPAHILTRRQGAAAAYEPGSFYKRELPLLLAVLDQAERLPETIVVDGYVWLDGGQRPGLGAMLHRALAEHVPIVGVAQTSFGDASSWCIPVLRGDSKRPLFVSSVGMSTEEAAQCVQVMHGRHRIPTLLQCVDRAARAALPRHEPARRRASARSFAEEGGVIVNDIGAAGERFDSASESPSPPPGSMR